MSKLTKSTKFARNGADGTGTADDPELRERVRAIIQTAGGTAFAKELFGVSREAMKQFIAGPEVGRSHAGTLALIAANEKDAEKKAARIVRERVEAKRERTAAAAASENKTKRKRAAKTGSKTVAEAP